MNLIDPPNVDRIVCAAITMGGILVHVKEDTALTVSTVIILAGAITPIAERAFEAILASGQLPTIALGTLAAAALIGFTSASNKTFAERCENAARYARLALLPYPLYLITCVFINVVGMPLSLIKPNNPWPKIHRRI